MDFREATDQLGLPLETVAEITRRSYATILAYRQGNREPPAEVWEALAQYTRTHSATLQGVASEMEQLARDSRRLPRTFGDSRDDEGWEVIGRQCPNCGDQLERRSQRVRKLFGGATPSEKVRCSACGWKEERG